MSDSLSNDLASLRLDREKVPPRKSPLKPLLAIALFCAAAAAGYLFALPWLRAKVFLTEVAVTEIALVSPAQAQIELTSSGYAVPQITTKVGPKETGRIAKVMIKEGDEVKTGQVIALLDPSDRERSLATIRSRVAAARARASAARANVAEIEVQLARARRLAGEGLGPQSAAEDLEARSRSLTESVKAADAEATAAQMEVQVAEVSLKNMTITSPMDGTVVNKPLEAGEVLSPGFGPSFVELADMKSLVIETDVPEGRLHLVKPGGPAEIVLDAYPQRRYRGRVLDVSPRVNRAKATVVVKVQFVDAAEGVLPEMAARVSFLAKEVSAEAAKEPPKLVVPAAAVTERSGAKVVFVVEGDKVRMVPLVLGEPVGPGFEVKQGPKVGTRVVKDPPADLTDGKKIKATS